ncbi:uncharacterized protein SPAPADRAFT_142653 [Spathaspora passalidarum NRRL Y-27907]|uniref:Uncharacterized protein n=1 Tax=Spathaspora passalidarum (strain NRRL Y-27907 / 11-Y1) TaxID=619300 RepID=G3ATE7_SPAPN|nr:uncharacterized protein SPAPADRAFT_142653 [Spathaspora passalidarum NRRL Y-27907]EGW30910.1 hypothetical protein SPAPADRAFT_142653 [Spathaspora passalidarum NRRL Y-27907]
MSEKEQLKQQEKEGSYNRPPMDAPPPYEEMQPQQQPQQQQYQQPYYDNPNQGYNPGYQQPGYNPRYPPANAYTIQPDKVNIAIAPPQHVNPQYPEFLAREQQRIQMGDYPDNYGKHGAPLNKGKTSKNAHKGFPGRSSATYHEAANK